MNCVNRNLWFDKKERKKITKINKEKIAENWNLIKLSKVKMDPKEISNFATLLRNNGDKVLNSEYKLTLSGKYKNLSEKRGNERP